VPTLSYKPSLVLKTKGLIADSIPPKTVSKNIGPEKRACDRLSRSNMDETSAPRTGTREQST
jgi:hypothetical protein